MINHRMNFVFKYILIILVAREVLSLYSPYYKRCRLEKISIDADAMPIQSLEVEKMAKYYSSFYVEPVVHTELELQYEDFQYYYHEYIDAGGSGEVYLVEDQRTGQGKIVKRYFKQKPKEFRRENYIMQRVNQSIQWVKDCGGFDCLPDTQQFHTLAIFPHKESITLRKLEFDGHEAPLIFYKILKQLQKTHKAGIIHNDIKMGNILVNSIGPTFKFYDVQLIDWNLASFYYTGYDSDMKRGTVCYYSPEQLFNTFHITPAIDVWALGVVMFTFYTDSKPFSFNCKSDNLRAIVSLVGGNKILDLYKKYRYNSIGNLNLLDDIEQNPSNFPEKDYTTIQIKSNKEFYKRDLIEVFKRMFEPDPELRATPEELMSMDYFKKIKKLPEIYSMKNIKKKKTISQESQKPV